MWNDCVEEISGEYHAAKCYLKSISIEKNENTEIELPVASGVIKDILSPAIPELNANLSNILKRPCKVTLKINKQQQNLEQIEQHIDKSNPDEVLKKMIEENEAILELKEKLNLKVVYQ